MNRMAGLVMMVIGVLVFIAGAVLFNNSKQKSKIGVKDKELEKAIEMAIADGVLTANERTIIAQLATEKNLNSDEVIRAVERQISELDSESETELVDRKKKNGDDFEKFIVQKFNRRYFRLKEWAGDKFVNGVYADTTTQPDLNWEFKMKGQTDNFWVECKWKAKMYEKGVEFASREQFKRYQQFEEGKKSSVFIAIGIGGKGGAPDQLFIVPLNELRSNFIFLDQLDRYAKKVDANFFYDMETKKLN